MKKSNPYGDDAGTRVGKPDTPKRANKAGSANGNTGAGKEMNGGVAKDGTPDSSGKAGARPLTDQDVDQGESGYGGNMGGPKTSRDKR